MPAFTFPTFKELDKNLEVLFRSEYEKYAALKSQVPAKREEQMQELDDLYSNLKKLSAPSDPQSLLDEHKKTLDEYYARLDELDEVSELSVAQEKEKNELTAKKDALLLLDAQLRRERNKELADEQKLRMLSDEQRAKVIVGALLVLQQKIKDEYEQGIANKLINAAAYIRLVKENKPENSKLYTGIPAAIGVTAENPLDDASRNEALAAYNQFAGVTQALTNDRKPLKKVATTEKQAPLVMRDFDEPSQKPVPTSSAKITALLSGVRDFDAANLNHVVTSEAAAPDAVIRGASPEEKVRADVKPLGAKLAGPQRAKWRENDQGEWVSHSHRKQYAVQNNEEDVAKVKEGWKGVKEPQSIEETYLTHKGGLMKDFAGFKRANLKHVDSNDKSAPVLKAEVEEEQQARLGM